MVGADGEGVRRRPRLDLLVRAMGEDPVRETLDVSSEDLESILSGGMELDDRLLARLETMIEAMDQAVLNVVVDYEVQLFVSEAVMLCEYPIYFVNDRFRHSRIEFLIDCLATSLVLRCLAGRISPQVLRESIGQDLKMHSHIISHLRKPKREGSDFMFAAVVAFKERIPAEEEKVGINY